jgi:hypothetical protein
MVERQSIPVVPDKPRPFRQNRGAAIMLALWALFVLSAMIISWALDVNTTLTNSGYANHSLEAIAMASSGVHVALHPSVEPGWAVLKGRFGSNQGYETRITGEAGRINLNWIVAGILGGQEIRREFLRKYLENKDIDLNERERMIDCLIDWVDPDNLVQANGNEEGAANRPLLNLDELKQVRGWEEFTSRPDWESDFTLYTPVTAAGAIDVRWASRDVLLALPGMTDGLVDRLISIRSGPDEIEGSEDDPTAPEFQSLIPNLIPQYVQLGPLLALQASPQEIRRIVSVGKSGPVTRTVRVVVRKNGNTQPTLVAGTWKEF